MRTRRLTLEEKIFFREILKDLCLPRWSEEKLRKTLDRVVYHDCATGSGWNPIVRTALGRGFAAITLGVHIYYNGEHFPNPGEKLELQCHELTHVCQVVAFGWGTSLWLMRYVGSWMRFPYPSIPFEKHARDMEDKMTLRLKFEPELLELLSRENRS